MDTALSSFTPEMIPARVGIAYRHRFPSSGVFQCSLTGLMFDVAQEHDIKYETLIWDDMVLEPARKVPGGPLFSFECPEDSICKLYLPHCEPEPDDGMSIIQPQEVTKTHVVLDNPYLTGGLGIVWDLTKRFIHFSKDPKPIYGRVVLFIRSLFLREKRIISVILVAGNTPLEEVKAQHRKLELLPVSPIFLLDRWKHYSLGSDPQGYRIQPTRTDYLDFYGPNYHASFEITVTTSFEEVTLKLLENPEMKPIWDQFLELPVSFPRTSTEENRQRMEKLSADEKLKSVQPHFVPRVSEPVVNRLVEELLKAEAISEEEAKTLREKKRADKARAMINIVQNKGKGPMSACLVPEDT